MSQSEPPRRAQLGFLHIPPFRVQGVSIAGEEAVVQVPELDVTFDIGLAPRPVLTSNYVALTHGHMDHSAGLPYYFSQRHFQGMGTGTVICPTSLEQPIHNVMRAWVDLEAQRTPYKVIPIRPDEEVQIKNGVFLRAFATIHTVQSVGFVVIERRSKLKPQYAGLSQEQIVELKKKGESITQVLDVPLVCYTGDTMWGPHFDRQDVLEAKILITECTFFDEGHRDRANVGKHLHVEDIAELAKKSKAQAIVLTHLSRRTHIVEARRRLDEVIPPEHRSRIKVLMDGRTNQGRREKPASSGDAADPGA